MQLQFNKTVIPCLHAVKRELQIQEQTQEVRLTDDMPDIGKVVSGWGQLVIRGKEWRNGAVSVSGGVMAWVMYLPEDGGEVQCVETWLPFQMKWEIPELQRDGSIHVMPLLRGVDVRSLSARKFMIRAGISVMGQIMLPGENEVYSMEDIPEDIQIMKNSYPMQIPAEAGEKAFSMEEKLQIEPEIHKIIRYHLEPRVMESRVIGDKVVVRGIAHFCVIYMSQDQSIHKWEQELPFSQYAELDYEYGEHADASIYMAVTALELDKTEEGIHFKAGLIAQYVIWDQIVVETIADLYSPYRALEVSRGQLHLPALLKNWKEVVPLDHGVHAKDMRVVDMVFYPDHPQLRREKGGIVAELSGMIQLLGYDSEGKPCSEISRWEQERKFDMEESLRLDLTAQMAGNSLEIGMEAFANEGMPMVTAVETAQELIQDPDRPSLILRKVAGESLWELAKQTGSTVEAIKTANGLQQEPEAGRLLLIPVS